MKQRLNWIDLAKGICLIAVILGHLGIEQLDFVYSFHLPVFFILSGYTLRKCDLTVDYVKQKFSRLMVPYFVTCGAVVAMDMVNAIVLAEQYSMRHLTGILYQGVLRTFFASGGASRMGSVEMGQRIGAIWFLPAMFFALILVQLVLRLRSKGLQTGASLVLFLLASASARVIWLPFSVQAAMFAVPFILVGKFLRDGEVLEKIKWWQYLLLLAAFVGGCYAQLAQPMYMVACSTKDLFFTPLFSLCSSLFIIGLARGLGRFAPLEFVGRNSMIFLCVHLFDLNTCSPYFRMLRNALHIPHTDLARIITVLVSELLVGSVLVWLLSRRKVAPAPCQSSGRRDHSIDLMRAMLIILMLVGHVDIHPGLRGVIYSFHMMAFVMVSGYFYSAKHTVGVQIKKAFKTLWPYATFAVLYLFFSQTDWVEKVKTLLCGVSFTKEVLPDIRSVGPVYFILMLFVVKVMYAFVGRIKNEWCKHGVVLAVFVGGILLGEEGIWLPFTIDGAMVSLLFYHIAYYLRQYDVLKKCAAFPAVYFPLACIWIYMVFSGSMELAVRQYGNVGVTIAGVVSVFIILYLLCHYLSQTLPRYVSAAAGWIGQATAYILVIHTIFGGRINAFVDGQLHLYEKNFTCFVVSAAIQVILGTLCCYLTEQVKKWWGQRGAKKNAVQTTNVSA